MNVLFLILKLWIIIINKIKFSFVFNYLPNCSSKIIFDDDDNDTDGNDGDGNDGDGDDGDDGNGDDDNDGDELLLSDWWLSSLFIIDNIFFFGNDWWRSSSCISFSLVKTDFLLNMPFS